MTRKTTACLLIGAGSAVILGVVFPALLKRSVPRPVPTSIVRHHRPVLLISIDTTRADHLTPYGATDIETPTFDALARDGIVMEQAFAVAPITLVAHTSILSGLYPPMHGVRTNGLHHVADRITTLPEILKEKGYRTAAFVSAAVLERRYGLDQGFEVYDDDLSTGKERRPRMVPDRPAEATVDAVFHWLENVKDTERFFLWVHFYDPHASYSPPPPFRDRYRNRLYDGEIAYLDSQIGRLLNHPTFQSHKDLVTIVVGDHGESLGEHGEQTHAILPYDSTLHVPMIFHFSGCRAGMRIHCPVSQVDIVPTLLDLLGLPIRKDLPGRSLLRAFSGLPDETRMLYSETFLPYYTYGWARLRVGRVGPWKFIEAPTPELYDLRRDPRELSNVIESNPGPAHDLSRDLDAMVTSMGDREENLKLDTESMARLQALGYVGGNAHPVESNGPRPDPKDRIGTHVDLEKARAFMRDRLWEKAGRCLDRVLEGDPNNLAALTEKANALAGLDKTDEAAAIIERALSLSPDSPPLLVQLSRLELKRHNPERSADLIDAALAIDPKFLPAVLARARSLANARDRSATEKFLHEAMNASPEDPRLETAMARLVDMPRGDLEKAEERVRKALTADPFLVEGYRLLGEVLQSEGHPEEALETYLKGLTRQPDDAELHTRCGSLFAEKGDLPRAEAHLREAIRLSSGFRSEAVVALGAVLAESGRLEEARKEYDKVLDKEPENPDARNNRAIALYRSGHREEAERELHRLITRFPHHADAWNNLAVIAIDEGNWKDAEEMSRRAAEINPFMASALNNLGIALDEQGRLKEAEETYARCLKVDPNYWQAGLNRAITLEKLGRFDDAISELERILDTVTPRADIHLKLGDLYAGKRETHDLAKKHYNAFLRLARRDPRAPEVAIKIADLE